MGQTSVVPSPAQRLAVLAAALLTAGCATPAQTQGAPAGAPPSLVVFITVDQLVPDYLDRFGAQLTGGLARMRDGGAYFTNAFHDHAITETAPGHASTLSGRFPRSTGIVSNVDGAFDVQSPLIAGARGEPASPWRFRGTTFGDWLRYRNPRARLLSVSRKDRGAIFPLGRAKGEAYWYGLNGMFTTSTWYADTLPTWVKSFNGRKLPQRLAGKSWELLLPASEYPEPDSVEIEAGGEDFAFPHRLPREEELAVAVLPNYPMMDEITLQFALAGLEARQLGTVNGRTDLLAVSVSSTDAVGHKFGPDSRELHDHILRLDRALGAFLDSLYKVRDSSRVVLALTSDHGVAPYPQAAIKSRYRDVPGGFADIRPVARRFAQSLASAGLDSSGFRYDTDVLFLEPRAFDRARINRDSVARAYAAEVARVEGVLRADVRSDLARADTTRDTIARRWAHMFPADIPAAVMVTLKPFWYWASVAQATHGSPHDYDARVPVIFAGAGVKPGRYSEFARVVDMAPTLAHLVSVRAAEPLDGVVLWSAIRQAAP
jgi:predicted AlkP superfamily pyrophosphatase or phosphodiesterase